MDLDLYSSLRKEFNIIIQIIYTIFAQPLYRRIESGNCIRIHYVCTKIICVSITCLRLSLLGKVTPGIRFGRTPRVLPNKYN